MRQYTRAPILKNFDSRPVLLRQEFSSAPVPSHSAIPAIFPQSKFDRIIQYILIKYKKKAHILLITYIIHN